MWLSECGYVPGSDELLREAAIRYFIVDAHALWFADRQPVHGVYAPIYCPAGVAAFGRDTESSQQVWSAKEGYPGNPDLTHQARQLYGARCRTSRHSWGIPLSWLVEPQGKPRLDPSDVLGCSGFQRITHVDPSRTLAIELGHGEP